MSKPLNPSEWCVARVGFYGAPCHNKALPGMHFCGVHKTQEAGLVERLKAARASRHAKNTTKS